MILFIRPLTLTLIILLLSLYFYNPLTSYFSQDDFFHLRSIMDKSLFDIPGFFLSTQKEYAFYRPLSRETFNLLLYKSLGLNASVFHLINFALILFNGFLIYRFLNLKFPNLSNFVIFFTLIPYLFSAIHSIELYYLASVQNLLSASFILLGLIFLEKRLLSIPFFILAIASHESAVVFIPIAAFLKLLNWDRLSWKNSKDLILYLLPFILIFFIRIIMHIYGFGLARQSEYLPNFSLQGIINTFIWLSLWSFGLPEMLVDFMTLTLNFNPNLFKYYNYYTNAIFPLFILMIFSGGFLILKKRPSRNLLFFVAAFLFSMTPYLFFPSHKFVYYLSLPIIWLSILIGIILSHGLQYTGISRLLVITFLIAYLIISSQTIRLNQETHWAAKRAESARFILSDLQKHYPSVEKGAIFYIRNDPDYPFIAKEWGSSSKQAFYILSGSDAFKLIYKDSTIKVYFEDVTGPPNENNPIIYVAKFPY